MNQNSRIVVLFAVRAEAKYFLPAEDCEVVVSGIGRKNAERAIVAALVRRPRLVFTCGFAGGLNTAHKHGDIIFESDADCDVADRLITLGARPGRFHCSDRIVTTVGEKKALHHLTGADAVEMESGVIRAVLRERGIPSATVRVISDDATEDLPTDFNKLSGADGNISYFKLAAALAKSPGLVPKLMRFQRGLAACSRGLARTLHEMLTQRS